MNKNKLSYKAFLRLLLDQYEPFTYEIAQNNPLYGNEKHQNSAVRHSKRFYHAYSTCFGYVKEGATVLDIGAYPGSYLKIMRIIYGSKISLLAAGMPVKKTFPSDLNTLGIDFIACDLDDALPTDYPATVGVPDSSVDVVFCNDMIEHLYSVKILMSEIRRILKPAGAAYISTNNIAYLPGLIRLLYGQTNLDLSLEQTSALAASEWRGHVRFYSLKQLATLAKLYELAIISKGYCQARAPKVVVASKAILRWQVSRLIDFFVTPLPLYRSHIYVLIQKPPVASG